MTATTVRPHRRNTSFAWTSCRQPGRPLRLLSDEQAAQWDDDGFVLLEQVLSADEVAAVEAVIDPAEEELTQFLRDETEDGTLFIARADEITFTTHLVARFPLLADLARHPVFLDLVHDVIGDDVRFYWDQAVYKKAHTVAPFPWHQDNGYAFVEPQQYLTCWIPLTDTDEANGCPWVVPGLHRRGTLHHESSPLGFTCLTGDEPEVADAVPVPARAGDVVVFSSLTPHTTGSNTTDATRKAYITQYAPEGAEVLRESIDHPDAAPDRVPATHPTRQFPVLVAGQPAVV